MKQRFEEEKKSILQHMRHHGVDVIDIVCSIQEKDGRQWLVPERRQLHARNLGKYGAWVPILDWGYDPTRWSFARDISESCGCVPAGKWACIRVQTKTVKLNGEEGGGSKSDFGSEKST